MSGLPSVPTSDMPSSSKEAKPSGKFELSHYFLMYTIYSDHVCLSDSFQFQDKGRTRICGVDGVGFVTHDLRTSNVTYFDLSLFFPPTPIASSVIDNPSSIPNVPSCATIIRTWLSLSRNDWLSNAECKEFRALTLDTPPFLYEHPRCSYALCTIFEKNCFVHSGYCGVIFACRYFVIFAVSLMGHILYFCVVAIRLPHLSIHDCSFNLYMY